MNTKKAKILEFSKSIIEFMKGNFERFNDEKLEIMINLIDYIKNDISDEESVIIYNQINSIENTLNQVMSGNDFDESFNKEFIRKDMKSLGTMYLMGVSLNKKIYTVDDNLIYYVINSLRGEKYDHYPILLKGLLDEELLNGVRSMQEKEPLDTDRIRSVFNSLVDNKILEDNMTEEEFNIAMQDYLEKKEISSNNEKRVF